MENKVVVGILNIVENKLREFGIQIPDEDRDGSSDPIVGYQYAELHDRILEYLEDLKFLDRNGYSVNSISKSQNETTQVKVIINDGIVEDVLKDKSTPIEVEVVDVNTDYEDYDELQEYRDEIYSNRGFIPCSYTTANFEDEIGENMVSPDISPIISNRITETSFAMLGLDGARVYVDFTYDLTDPMSEWDTTTVFAGKANNSLDYAQKLLAKIADVYGVLSYDESQLSLTRFPVKVEFVDINEGYHGEYDRADPEDEKLLRFDVSVCRDGIWETKNNGSYCTLFPVSSDILAKRDALEILMDNFYPALSEDIDVSIKKIGEKLSWISPDNLDQFAPVKSSLTDIIGGAKRRHKDERSAPDEKKLDREK